MEVPANDEMRLYRLKGVFEMEKMIDCMVKQACERFFNLKEDYDFEEIKKTSQKVYDIYWDNDLFKEVKTNLETAIGESEAAYERQGFVLGFKEAIKMLQQAD